MFAPIIPIAALLAAVFAATESPVYLVAQDKVDFKRLSSMFD